MENHIEAADFVLLMCTPHYLKRYRGEEREGGKGVTFEGVIISQHLYDNYYQSTKFVPLIPEQGSWKHVPTALRKFGHWRMPTDYNVLYHMLSGQVQFEVPDVKKPSIWRWFKPAFKRELPSHSISVYEQRFPVTDLNAMVGRNSLLSLLNQYWEQESVRVVVLQAFGGTGKTALVNLWRAHLWRGDGNLLPVERIYCWSFQDQGSGRKQTSSEAFFRHALNWFGAEQTRFNSPQEKGVYLARLTKQQRTLLILDGLEVFQPYHHLPELKDRLSDQAIFALFKTLAQEGNSLCLLTTRKSIDPQLQQHKGLVEYTLDNLSSDVAVQLLRDAGVKGKDTELKAVAEQDQGHAYSLVLVASYLKTHAKGDIRRLDTLPPLLADEGDDTNWQGRQIMQAYAEELAGTEDLGLLYVVSVFDQMVEHELIAELIRALKTGGYETALNKLNIARLSEAQRWAACCERLRKQGLLLGNNAEWLDLHPLVRAFFRSEFVHKLGGVKNLIHRTLYDYYKTLPEKELPDTLEEMQPLFSAVAHGCAAGLHQQVEEEVYWPRILRKDEHYLTKKLGALGDDLTTVAHFFTIPWHIPAASLTEGNKAVVLSWAGFGLRALGRLREALEPMQASLDMLVKQEDWKQAAEQASNLSELATHIGDVAQAVECGARSHRYADQSGDMFERMSERTTHADALHQVGDTDAALALFREAEQLQQEREPEYPRLYSQGSFRYCGLLLAQGSTAEVLERAEYALNAAITEELGLLSVALDQLTLGCAYLQQTVEASPAGDFYEEHRLQGKLLLQQAREWLDQAVAGLHVSGEQIWIASGLLARAAFFRHTHDFARARQDLQEVFDIAEPSGMRLHLTDYHLEMARVLVAEKETPPNRPAAFGCANAPLSGEGLYSESAQAPSLIREGGGWVSSAQDGLSFADHVKAAAKLITETGYHRRDKELAELQQQVA